MEKLDSHVGNAKDAIQNILDTGNVSHTKLPFSFLYFPPTPLVFHPSFVFSAAVCLLPCCLTAPFLPYLLPCLPRLLPPLCRLTYLLACLPACLFLPSLYAYQRVPPYLTPLPSLPTLPASSFSRSPSFPAFPPPSLSVGLPLKLHHTRIQTFSRV